MISHSLKIGTRNLHRAACCLGFLALGSSLWGQAVRSNPGFRASSLARGDDDVSSPPATLGFRVNFFGRQFDQVYVNNNGNISFGTQWTDFTPQSLDRLPVEIIAPFWADVDTTAAGAVTYGRDTVNGRPAFGATYTNVGYFNSRSDKTNTFQVVLIDRADTGTGNFDIEMNYGQIRWEAGEADGGVAGLCPAGPSTCVPPSVGYSNGSGQTGTFSTLAGSLLPGAFLDTNSNGLTRRSLNSGGVAGRLVYSARSGSIVTPISISSLNPISLPAGSGASTIQVNGSGFGTGALVYFDNTPLPTPSSITATQIATQIPANLLTSARTYQVTIRQGGNVSNALTFSVTGTTTIPPISITGLTGNLSLGSSTNIGLQLASPAASPLTGRIDATFVPNAIGVPNGYRDPAMQFASGGISITFNVAPGQSVAILPNNGAFNFGTVAGTITFRLSSLTSGATNLLPSPAPATTAAFGRSVPVVTPGSVRLVNVSGGFNVELQGYSTPRDLVDASFQFNLAGNARAEGETTLIVSLATLAPGWFASGTGQNSGSRFFLSVPFTASADPNLVQSVSVTLRNSVGSSGSASGGR